MKRSNQFKNGFDASADRDSAGGKKYQSSGVRKYQLRTDLGRVINWQNVLLSCMSKINCMPTDKARDGGTIHPHSQINKNPVVNQFKTRSRELGSQYIICLFRIESGLGGQGPEDDEGDGNAAW